jgi:hypothetical protein
VFPFSFTSVILGQWIEPENSGLVNQVGLLDMELNSLVVFSDVIPFRVPTPVADGTSRQIGTDQNSVPIIATFHDNAAPTEVPDTGSTFVLLLLSLIALLGATRLRSVRLA